MRRISTIFITLLAVLYFAGCGQQGEQAIEEITAAHPDHAGAVFENDYVKAVEFTLEPGEKLPLHKGGPRAVYALSDYKIKWNEGGQVTEKEWKTGDAHWHGAIEHAVENIGDTPARYLVVTRTETALPGTGDYDLSRDASQLDSEHSEVVFENEHVRIIEVMLGAGESQPMHEGINRLIYSLTGYRLNYSSDQMDTKETEMEAGEAHWHTADAHAVENIGETPAHYLIFEFMN